MNSDNYEFSKSSQPQGVNAYSSYTDKQWNYVNDINSGVYSNNSGLTQVQFDMSSIYNSGGFTDTSDLYLTIPIVMTAQYATSAGAVVALPSLGSGLGQALASLGGCAGFSLCSMKSNYQNLVHQIEIQIDGKNVNETQPFVNVFQNFRMISQMSTTDLHTMGPSLGFSSVLDNEKSVSYAATTGLSNNVPFTSGLVVAQTTNIVAGVAVGGTDQAVSGVQNVGTVNTAISKRLSRIVDTSSVIAGPGQKIYGEGAGFIMSGTQLGNEYKPYFTYVASTSTLVWYDVAILPLKFLTDAMDKIGLVRKLSAIFRLYINTGSLSIAVTNPGLSTQLMAVKQANSTFPNTCPFTVNNVPSNLAANGGTIINTGNCPLTTAFVCAGLFVSKAPSTAIPVGGGSINIGNGVASHAMPSCRCYYSLVKMEPSKALMYVEQNRSKLVVYEQIISNSYANIGTGNSFSQLVQSGIKNPLGICIIPLLAQATTGVTQYGSCTDTCPASYSPISLSNLQVTLGGQNVLNSTLFYTYENFLEQVLLADTLTSSDLGIGAGMISQSWWEANRVYWVDLKRSRDADKASTRNLNISFTNNSLVAIDCLVFTVYLDKLTLDVETGLVRK